MPFSWRRVTESLFQVTHIGHSLSPTSNDRNRHMLLEAAKFKGYVDNMITRIRGYQAGEEAMLSSMRNALMSPVPRVFHEMANSVPDQPRGIHSSVAPGGNVAKVRGLTTLVPCSEKVPIASDLDVEQIAVAETEMRAALFNDIIVPLHAWIDAYERIKGKQHELEQMRLEVDSRRRTVASLTVVEAKAQAAVQRSQDNASMLRLEDATARLRHKTDKLNAAAARYNELETTQHTELTTLIQDTVHLRSFVSNALRMQGEGLLRLAQQMEGPLGAVPVDVPPTVLQSANLPAAPGTITLAELVEAQAARADAQALSEEAAVSFQTSSPVASVKDEESSASEEPSSAEEIEPASPVSPRVIAPLTPGADRPAATVGGPLKRRTSATKAPYSGVPDMPATVGDKVASHDSVQASAEPIAV